MNATNIAKLTLLSFIILALLLFSGYQFVALPIEKEIQSLESEIEMETKRYQSLEVLENKPEDPGEIKLNQLKAQLPTNPLLDQLILDLEKAELASNTLILNMSFGVASLEQPAEDSATDQTEETDSTETSTTTSFPNGVEKLTVSMSVQAPSHNHLELFLKELEEMERIIQVENLAFSGGEGQTNETNSTVVFSIQISAFYYPNGEIMETNS
ncbi:hypothetical protein GCM10008967_25940 [Bacillus carboniphilus]|uniref:Uncharacterized protein n=1 Tax=Bacillus carboniphilus TaxID=86663 RepID=A0ABP3G2W7_9BACI